MTFSLPGSTRPVPAEYRANFTHLYLDIAWFGVLNGSAMAFVAVYAARQGATAFQLGLITAGPALVNLLCALPAGQWLEKRPVAPAVFWTALLHRFFYLLWVPLPILLNPQAQVWILLGLILLMSVPGTALAVGFNALFADVVPPEWRGHVVGIRNALLAATLIATSLLCGLILAHFPFSTEYQLIFGLGLLGAALSSFHLWFVRPAPIPRLPGRSGHSLGDLARPGIIRTAGDTLRPGVGLRFLARSGSLRSLRPEILTGSFGTMVALLFIFHLALYLASPIFPLYWVEELHLSDQAISLGTALFYLTVLVGSTQLDYLTQKLGNHRLTALGGMLLSAYPGLTALSHGMALYLVASAVGGLAWALAGGALNNYVLEKVPPDDRPAYLAWYNLAINAAILFGSLAGPYYAGKLGLGTALALFAILRLLAAFSILRWGA